MEPMNFGFFREQPLAPNGRKVAIIGAGPSGLAAAGYLACLGYQVDVFDKLPRAGGLMLFGIPAERIPAARVEGGARLLERRYGVNFHLHTKICCSAPLHEEEGDHFSQDIRSMDELVESFDAVVICTGSWRSRRLNIPGEELEGVYSSLEFLFPLRAARFGSPKVCVPPVEGRRVVVVGGGFSAVDVAESSVNLQADKVVVLYRRTANEAPCGRYELEKLARRGVEIIELATPKRILGRERVESMEIIRCRLGDPDEEGRRCPVPEEGKLEQIPVDMVVTAIGETATPPFAKELGLENVRRGEVRWLHMTSIENVFVAGDALTGPSKIGKAVYSGLRAARSLTNWLDLKAQHREEEYRYDDLMAKEQDREARPGDLNG
ncbi:MAG: FAD-dependent oxidoreductase [Desulfovibrionales bacterium]